MGRQKITAVKNQQHKQKSLIIESPIKPPKTQLQNRQRLSKQSSEKILNIHQNTNNQIPQVVLGNLAPSPSLNFDENADADVSQGTINNSELILDHIRRSKQINEEAVKNQQIVDSLQSTMKQLECKLSSRSGDYAKKSHFLNQTALA